MHDLLLLKDLTKNVIMLIVKHLFVALILLTTNCYLLTGSCCSVTKHQFFLNFHIPGLSLIGIFNFL